MHCYRHTGQNKVITNIMDQNKGYCLVHRNKDPSD